MIRLTTSEAFKHVGSLDGMVAIEGDVLQRLQDELLVMLGDVIDVCERHGIQYTLGGGTCLGAVRHGGFIPWDDDIDINIARASLDLFIVKFREEQGDRYWIHHPLETPGYGMGFIQLRKKGTVFRTREDYATDECGIPLDIFIMENVPDNIALRGVHGVGSLALGFLLSCRKFSAYGNEYLKLTGDNASTRRLFKAKIAIGRMASIVSIDGWCHAWYRWNALCKDNDSRYVTAPVGRNHYFGELLPRSVFFPAINGRFAGLAVRLPSEYDTYLQSLYGKDYMQWAPEHEREAHAVYELDFGDAR